VPKRLFSDEQANLPSSILVLAGRKDVAGAKLVVLLL